VKKKTQQSPLFAELAGPIPPREFPAFDENLEVDHACAACGYLWSGGDEAAPEEEADKFCPRCGAAWTAPDEHANQERMF